MIAGSRCSPKLRSTLLHGCLLALLLILSTPVVVRAVHGGSDREVEVGDVLPVMEKRTVQGDSTTIPAGEGTTVLLFWATWSPRSLEALSLWEKFGEDYADQPLRIITVNAEHETLSGEDLQKIEGYIAENIKKLPVILDEGLELFNTYAVKALPTAFFLDGSGKLVYRYASLPTSAAFDLQEELEVTLGLKERQSQEETTHRGQLEYQPKNNALLHYNMAVQLYKKGYREKALERIVIALQKDPEYEAPLRTLEGIYSPEGSTPEGETRLRDFLLENGLEAQVERIGTGEPILIDAPKKIDAMERMRLLMESNKPAPGTSP